MNRRSRGATRQQPEQRGARQALSRAVRVTADLTKAIDIVDTAERLPDEMGVF